MGQVRRVCAASVLALVLLLGTAAVALADTVYTEVDGGMSLTWHMSGSTVTRTVLTARFASFSAENQRLTGRISGLSGAVPVPPYTVGESSYPGLGTYRWIWNGHYTLGCGRALIGEALHNGSQWGYVKGWRSC